MAKADGRRADKRGRSKDAPPFVQMPWWVMETPAYHSLTPEARTALLYMAKRYYGHNNGRIGFGVRSGGFVRNHAGQPDADLVDVPVMSSSRMHRALIEVEALGFAIVTKESTFGQKKMTREWRLTWLGSDIAGESKVATKDFMALSMADCRRIQADLRTKASPAGAIKSPRTVALAGQSPQPEAPKGALQSRGRDYDQSSQSRWRDTSSNHPIGEAAAPRSTVPLPQSIPEKPILPLREIDTKPREHGAGAVLADARALAVQRARAASMATPSALRFTPKSTVTAQ